MVSCVDILISSRILLMLVVGSMICLLIFRSDCLLLRLVIEVEIWVLL